MRIKKCFCVLLLFCFKAYSQTGSQPKSDSFENIVLKIDTAFYSTQKNTYTYQKESYLFFKSINNQDYCELTLFPKEDTTIQSVQLLGSNDFILVDSIRHFSERYFRGKIRFNDLGNAKYLSLIFLVKLRTGKTFNYELKLMPYAETYVSYDNDPIDLFLEEEKVIELPCLNVYNIRMEGDWSENPEYEIKLSQVINALRISIKPKTLGTKVFTLKLKTIRPFINSGNEISYDLVPIKIKFHVKPNRIDYVNPERSTIFFNPDFKVSEEIQLDYNRNMGLKKTYRIEDQQENGGNLIAEIFTQSQVGNSNKVICKIRTFSLHRVGEGYLYIKDGDKTRFLTNFNIIEKPRIDAINIMHNGSDWTGNLSVLPGEKIEMRITGTGLQQSGFQFEGIENVYKDTARLSDEVAFYSFTVPLNIPKKSINIFMNKKSTQYSLQVREFQKPSEFDFINVNYAGTSIPLSSDVFDKPIFYDGTIKDVNISFDRDKIDDNGKLFGKQYLNIEVRVLNLRNELMELQMLNNVVVCPSENSPRSSFYDLSDCKNQTINLNDFLTRKTYSYDAFTQMFITISHVDGKYSSTGYSKKIKLIVKRKYNFDIQVSFPAGILLYKFKQDPADNSIINNLSGISLAFIAQMRFYDGENVNRFKPYQFGAGFIAFDAFNFSSSSTNRDLGVVVLGSLVPYQNSRLSFPLYFGGGFLLNKSTWMLLFGPGIYIRL